MKTMQELVAEAMAEQNRKQFRRYETVMQDVAMHVYRVAKLRGFQPAYGRKRNAEGQVIGYCIQIWGTADEMHRVAMAGIEAATTAVARKALEAVGQGHLCGRGKVASKY